MAIEWNPSRGVTLGVEWEVQLIDGETKLLRQEAGKLLDQLPVADDTGEHPRIRHELMQSTLELVTGICSTVSEAKDDLSRDDHRTPADGGGARYPIGVRRDSPGE